MPKKTFLRISSKVDGFRRAGVAHSRNATDWPKDAFKDEQRAQLEAEPNLLVQEIEKEVEEDAPADETAPKPNQGNAGNKGGNKGGSK